MNIIIETDQEEDGRWIADAPELPGVLAYGQTREQAIAFAEALALRVIAERLEHGESYSCKRILFVGTSDNETTHFMNTVKIVFWEDNDVWLGYLQDYPDYWTQGDTLDDLKEHLKDLHQDITGDFIKGIRKVDELVLS